MYRVWKNLPFNILINYCQNTEEILSDNIQIKTNILPHTCIWVCRIDHKVNIFDWITNILTIRE